MVGRGGIAPPPALTPIKRTLPLNQPASSLGVICHQTVPEVRFSPWCIALLL